MAEIENLIEQLSKQSAPKKILNPWQLFFGWLVASLIYSAAALAFMGIRPDIALELEKGSFILEFTLLAAVVVSSITGAIWLSYPDIYQQNSIIYLPFIALCLFIGFLIYDYFNIPPGTAEGSSGVECLICITLLSLAPSLFVFYRLRQNATTHLLLTGMFAVLSSAALGALILKIVEDTNSVAHLLLWHYLPFILFSAAGIFLGRKFLRW